MNDVTIHTRRFGTPAACLYSPSGNLAIYSFVTSYRIFLSLQEDLECLGRGPEGLTDVIDAKAKAGKLSITVEEENFQFDVGHNRYSGEITTKGNTKIGIGSITNVSKLNRD